MAAPSILFELLGCGIEPTLTADGASIEVPAGRLSDAQRQAVRDHKAELIRCIREAEGITEKLVRQTKAGANDDAHHLATPTPDGDRHMVTPPHAGDQPVNDPPAQADEEIERHVDRVTMLIGRGLTQPRAERLAAALGRRDRDLDDRRTCFECGNMSGNKAPRFCHRGYQAGLTVPPRPPSPVELPRTWTALLQRCPAFAEVTP